MGYRGVQTGTGQGGHSGTAGRMVAQWDRSSTGLPPRGSSPSAAGLRSPGAPAKSHTPGQCRTWAQCGKQTSFARFCASAACRTVAYLCQVCSQAKHCEQLDQLIVKKLCIIHTGQCPCLAKMQYPHHTPKRMGHLHGTWFPLCAHLDFLLPLSPGLNLTHFFCGYRSVWFVVPACLCSGWTLTLAYGRLPHRATSKDRHHREIDGVAPRSRDTYGEGSACFVSGSPTPRNTVPWVLEMYGPG